MNDPMPTGWRKVGAATARVRRHPHLPAKLQARTREVIELECTDQRKGYATTLMHSICREADKHGITLVLTPGPFGDNISMSTEELTSWYERRFGFMVIQSEPTLMARMPGSTPRLLQLNMVTEALHKEKQHVR